MNNMSKRIVPYCTLLIVVFTSTLLAWAPFLLSHSFETVYKHFDGPLYIIPAKTGYDPVKIESLLRDPSMPKNPIYYAAHLPGYPLLIWFISLAGIGFLKSMIAATLLSTLLFAWGFYYVVKRMQLSKYPLLLTSIILFAPRFLVVRSIGSPEPLFMVAILCSLYCFEKKHYFGAGLAGALAVAIKVPGILLFPAFVLALIERKLLKPAHLFLLLIPIALVAVFQLYANTYGDFFAYFHTGGTVPMPYPFSVFNASAKWVGTAWLEDVWFYFVVYAATAVQLWKSPHRSFFYFSIVFLAGTLFVEHRDISRYTLPLLPLAVIAFENQLTQKKFYPVLALGFIAAYAYAWNFIGANTMPITEWLPFL
jgi:4-amino-4-deoxy-L-arabinose transferase-like glycosyltransferase